jgi:hypothetical protein
MVRHVSLHTLTMLKGIDVATILIPDCTRCCIDKGSSAELSEAINSMFRWYERAVVCYVYLSDIHSTEASDINTAKWFRRGWTLQELLAPATVRFYTASWNFIGTKLDLISTITSVTGIDADTLRGADLDHISIAKKMSWAATRETTRVEDGAYCLLGIFDVNMPLLYGEAERAFQRLQEEILKVSNDQSLFAWGVKPGMRILDASKILKPPNGLPKLAEGWTEAIKDLTELDMTSERTMLRGLFARSPKEFLYCGDVTPIWDWPGDTGTTLTAREIRLVLPVLRDMKGELFGVAILGCWVASTQIAISLVFRLWHGFWVGRLGEVIGVPIQHAALKDVESMMSLFDHLKFKEETVFPTRNGRNIVVDTELIEKAGFFIGEILCAPTASWDGLNTLKISDRRGGRHAVMQFKSAAWPNKLMGHKIAIVGTFVDPDPRIRGGKEETYIRVQDHVHNLALSQLLFSPEVNLSQGIETEPDFIVFSTPDSDLPFRMLNNWTRESIIYPDNPLDGAVTIVSLKKSLVPMSMDCKSEDILRIATNQYLDRYRAVLPRRFGGDKKGPGYTVQTGPMSMRGGNRHLISGKSHEADCGSDVSDSDTDSTMLDYVAEEDEKNGGEWIEIDSQSKSTRPITLNRHPQGRSITLTWRTQCRATNTVPDGKRCWHPRVTFPWASAWVDC